MVQGANVARHSITRWLWIVVVVAMAGCAFAFQSQWLPKATELLSSLRASSPRSEEGSKEAEHTDAHAGHDHAGHNEANSVELSEQARKNIGLTVGRATLSSYTRTVTIPGIVVEMPGRSTVKVTTPMTGIVTRIIPSEGQSVESGQALFELRLTHEEIVQAQADLLRTSEELDVVAREIARLEKITADGAIAGKTLLERKYEQQKLNAVNRSQQQALLLHGLSSTQVQSILDTRSLLQSITVRAPSAAMDPKSNATYQIQEISVSPGQQVNAGDSLAVLVDYSTLLIEGNAFEVDSSLISRAVREDRSLVAILDREGARGEEISNLKILYQGSKIDPETRAVHFYVALPNELEGNGDREQQYPTWRYRPGQRMRLLVPAESWENRIVLPAAAVAQDGVETYVFVPNGDHLDRRAVHVEHRNDLSVVIENDGAIFPGDNVALNGAQQLQLALKNKAGGGVDPHAGHNH